MAATGCKKMVRRWRILGFVIEVSCVMVEKGKQEPVERNGSLDVRFCWTLYVVRRDLEDVMASH